MASSLIPHNQTKKPLSTLKILCQALKLSTNTRNCIIAIFSFLSSTILFSITYFLLTPLTADLTAKYAAIASLDPNSPEYALLRASIIKDFKEYLGIQAIFIPLSFISYSLVSFATIHTYTNIIGEFFSSCKPMLVNIGSKLKGLMITRLYITLFNLGFILLLPALTSFIFSFIIIISSSMKVLITVVGVVLGTVIMLVFMYLNMVWSVGVVVSVVEEGCFGLDAISKAGEVIKGRRRQGVLLFLILSCLIGVVSGAYYIDNMGSNTAGMAKLVVGLFYTFVSALMGLFEWAVILVFYCDCKESKGELIEQIQDATGFKYSSLPKETTSEHDHDQVFP